MAFVAMPNIVQIEWRYTLFGQQCENRVYVDHFGAPTQADLDGYALRAWTWWVDTYAANVSSAVNLREVVTTDMGNQNGNVSHYAPSATVFGEDVSTPLPNEVSFAVTLTSNSRGRSARGRWFVAGVPTAAQQDANNLTVVKAGAFVSALQVFINAMEAIGKAVVIVSLRSNNAPRPGGPVYFPVIAAAFTDTLLDSQKRRKPGIGI